MTSSIDKCTQTDWKIYMEEEVTELIKDEKKKWEIEKDESSKTPEEEIYLKYWP